MAIKTNERPIANIKLFVIARYPDGKAYATKHIYNMNMANDNGMLLETMKNVMGQRFPHAESIDFVTKTEWLSEVEKGAIVQNPVDNKKTVLFDTLPA